MIDDSRVTSLASFIREVPDFPRPGVLFRDITPLLQDPGAFRCAVDNLIGRVAHMAPDVIVAIEARGFLFGAPMAYALGKPLIPVRKVGKLPGQTHAAQYALEYGEATVEVHRDGIRRGERVLLVDDLLATGGTLAAGSRLVREAGGVVAGMAVLIELAGLHGRDRLGGDKVISLLTY